MTQREAAVHSIREAIDAAPAHQPEEPRPLIRAPGEPSPYPIDALGPLRDAARAIVAHTQAPEAIAGQSVLAAAALAVQGHADALHPATDQRTPLSLFALTIAESGERKSAVDRLALKGVADREETLSQDYREDAEEYASEREIYEAKKEALLRRLKKKRDDAEAEAALRELGPGPSAPLTPMLICSEPTYEGYVRLTAGGQPSMGLFSDEGGAFFGGFGMSADQRLKTAAALSDLWDGKPIKRVRAGDGSFILPGRRLSLHLMAQPGVAWNFLGDPLLADQGLLSRVLVSAPASTMGTRFFAAPSPEAQAALRAYHAHLGELLNAPLPLAEGAKNELEPRALPLSPEAQDEGVAYSDAIERELAPDARLRPISGFAAKATEQATRIAGVLTLVLDLNASRIEVEQMRAGIALMDHYLAEMIRLRDAAAIPQKLRDVVKLWDWIQRVWEEPAIYPTPIYRSGPLRSLRNRGATLQALKILEEHRWLQPIKGGAVVEGKWRKEAWRIHGRAFSQL